MTARDDILSLLKRSAPMTAAQVGAASSLTSMGARGHLERLQRDGLVFSQETIKGRGRPRKQWYLSEDGHARFGDRHDNLTVELIGHVRELFGEVGLKQLILARERHQLDRYRTAIEHCDSAQSAIEQLAAERTREGYMAEVIATDNGWELIEHHCPICSAAEQCQSFCRSELAVFQDSLGPEYRIDREEHLMQDGKRCRYRIQRKGSE